jgi:hypothetical protein
LIPADSCADRFGVVAHGDGSDPLGCGDKFVPRDTTRIDDSFVCLENAIAEFVLPEEFPDVLDGVQFG